MSALIDRLSPREYAGAAIAALLRRNDTAPQAPDAAASGGDGAAAETMTMPTAAQIAAAFDAGVPAAIDAIAGSIVERATRAARAEPRTTQELAQGSIDLAKRIHKGVNGVLGFVADVAASSPKTLPNRGPVKASPAAEGRGRVAGGTGGGEAVTIDFEPDDGG